MSSDFGQPVAVPTTKLGLHQVLSTNAGVRVSPLCLGGMSLGTAFADFMGSMSKDQVFALLDEFQSLGGNFIDVANNYQDGQSESWVGEWMASRKNRESVVLATKYGFNLVDRVKHRGPMTNNQWGNHRRSLHASLRRSLERLQTDFVDILYVHFWDYTTSIPELMNSLHALVEQGKVLYLGISDTPAWVVAIANSYAAANGKTPFSIYQGRWNVLFRDLEREIVPMANHFGMAIACWNAIGSGRFQTPAQIAERESKGEGIRPSYDGSLKQTDVEGRMSKALADVANEQGVDSAAAVALAYLRSKAPRVIPIVGGRKIEHLRDNVKSLEMTLTRQQIDRIERVIEFDLGFPVSMIGQDYHLTGQTPGMAMSNGTVALS